MTKHLEEAKKRMAVIVRLVNEQKPEEQATAVAAVMDMWRRSAIV
jgi:hypothetical protein